MTEAHALWHLRGSRGVTELIKHGETDTYDSVMLLGALQLWNETYVHNTHKEEEPNAWNPSPAIDATTRYHQSLLTIRLFIMARHVCSLHLVI